MSKSDVTSGSEPSAFSRQVGRRLRGVRRARGMSLDEVERQSGGRWSASAIGAYERGFRNLTLPRLQELAEFFSVPMGVLLGESESAGSADATRRLRLDLGVLENTPAAVPVLRYLRTIIHERGDYNGRVLSVRRDDVRALSAVLQVDEDGLFELLSGWGALIDNEYSGGADTSSR